VVLFVGLPPGGFGGTIAQAAFTIILPELGLVIVHVVSDGKNPVPLI
jgi:hypothetical protein